MKVLFLSTRDRMHPEAAGGDIQSWEYARYLAGVGHAVTFLAAGYPGAPKEELVDGIRVIRWGRVLTLWFHAFMYYIRHGRGKCDVVVSEGFGGSRIPRLAPLYVREPIVTEWRQIHTEIFENQYPRVFVGLLTVLERLAAWVHRRTIVLAFTEEWRERFRTLGFQRDKIWTVPVSIGEGWLGTEHSRLSRAPRIVWIGKFRRYKCPHHVVLAMAHVTRELPDARALLAGRHGDRKYEDSLRRLVARLGLQDNVEIIFDLSEEEKRALLMRSRVLVLPSPVEGFGIVVLEANACGVPVVASSGVPVSVVQNDYTGLRFPFGNIPLLAEKITRILRDDSLYARLSTNCRGFARQFAWQKVGAQFEEVIRCAVEGRARSAQGDRDRPETTES